MSQGKLFLVRPLTHTGFTWLKGFTWLGWALHQGPQTWCNQSKVHYSRGHTTNLFTLQAVHKAKPYRLWLSDLDYRKHTQSQCLSNFTNFIPEAHISICGHNWIFLSYYVSRRLNKQSQGTKSNGSHYLTRAVYSPASDPVKAVVGSWAVGSWIPGWVCPGMYRTHELLQVLSPLSAYFSTPSQISVDW